MCRIASFGLCLFSVLFYTSRVFAVTVGQRTLFRTMSSDECYSDEDFEDDFEDLTEVSPSKEPLEESSDSVLGTSLPLPPPLPLADNNEGHIQNETIETGKESPKKTSEDDDGDDAQWALDPDSRQKMWQSIMEGGAKEESITPKDEKQILKPERANAGKDSKPKQTMQHGKPKVFDAPTLIFPPKPNITVPRKNWRNFGAKRLSKRSLDPQQIEDPQEDGKSRRSSRKGKKKLRGNSKSVVAKRNKKKKQLKSATAMRPPSFSNRVSRFPSKPAQNKRTFPSLPSSKSPSLRQFLSMKASPSLPSIGASIGGPKAYGEARNSLEGFQNAIPDSVRRMHAAVKDKEQRLGAKERALQACEQALLAREKTLAIREASLSRKLTILGISSDSLKADGADQLPKFAQNTIAPASPNNNEEDQRYDRGASFGNADKRQKVTVNIVESTAEQENEFSREIEFSDPRENKLDPESMSSQLLQLPNDYISASGLSLKSVPEPVEQAAPKAEKLLFSKLAESNAQLRKQVMMQQSVQQSIARGLQNFPPANRFHSEPRSKSNTKLNIKKKLRRSTQQAYGAPRRSKRKTKTHGSVDNRSGKVKYSALYTSKRPSFPMIM